MLKEKFILIAATLTLTVTTGIAISSAHAQKQQGCYIGRDHSGNQVVLRLVAEKIRNSFEIYGTLRSSSFGTMRVKADGWSGNGRIFRRHEYESGAKFVRISNYTGTRFTFSVQGIGSFPFQQAGC